MTLMDSENSKRLRYVGAAGVSLLAIFAVVATLGGSLGWLRAIPWVVGLWVLWVVVVMAALSLSLTVDRPDYKRLVFIIVCIALGLRGVALVTSPILEIDYYRYLWDGKVLAEGVSPYAYSPAQILDADKANPDEAYQRVVSLSLKSESNHEILNRIHFAKHTTIYPPVSQFVFAAAMKWFPAGASAKAHVVWMKLVLVVFDLLTIVLVLKLLVDCGFSPGWLIAYAWNPLVIKEVANSGHLDSIAVFFVVAAVFVAAKSLRKAQETRGQWQLWVSASSLALGFGAKLFPIILLPLFVVVFSKVRWHRGAVFLIAFAIPASGICWLMGQALADRQESQLYFAQQGQPSQEGLGGFLSTWRMNDVVFSTLYRNLNPSSDSKQQPWFVLTANQQRQTLDRWGQQFRIGRSSPAFFLTRLVTLLIFFIVYGWILVRTYRNDSPGEDRFPIGNIVWILTVFLFLQPTVNPWYWLWVVPFTCFANHKGWTLISGFLLVYYVRFWFKNVANFDFAGEPYQGVGMFDNVVAWAEFAAIAVVIGWIRFGRDRLVRGGQPDSDGYSDVQFHG